MKYIFAAVLIPILAFLAISCAEDNPPPPPTVTMTILDAPDALLANVDTCYQYRVRIENGAADSVTVEVRDPDHQFHSTFALYDDGGQGSAFPEYACEGSGDIIPNDHIFSRRINGRLLADSVIGDYAFVFRAPNVAEQTRPVQVMDIEPCLITSYPQIQTFETCFAPMTLEVRVARTEGDVVDRVAAYLQYFTLPGGADTLEFDAVSSDTVWQAMLTPQLFECVNEDGWGLSYEATTRFGMVCAVLVGPLTYVNSLPVLSNSTLPDTIYRPTTPGDSTLSVVTVDLADCELAGELYYYGLEFETYRDWQEWGRSEDFFLRDDGTSPDMLGGDGTFSSWLVIDNSDSLFNNLYYFRFYAIECAAPYDTSEYLMDSVRVIQPGAVMSPLDPPAKRRENDVDFRVWQYQRAQQAVPLRRIP